MSIGSPSRASHTVWIKYIRLAGGFATGLAVPPMFPVDASATAIFKDAQEMLDAGHPMSNDSHSSGNHRGVPSAKTLARGTEGPIRPTKKFP